MGTHDDLSDIMVEIRVLNEIVREVGKIKIVQRISIFTFFLVFILELASCNAESANPLETYQCFDGVTVSDIQSGLTWQKSDDGVRRTWVESRIYCQDLILAGFNDWRLPNKEELFGLILKDHGSPTINEVFNCRKSEYWSGTGSIFKAAWYVDFRYGLLKVYHTDYPRFLVRCVRERHLYDDIDSSHEAN